MAPSSVQSLCPIKSRPKISKASYRDGVEELTAPMPQESTPKEVKIGIVSPDK